MARENELKTDFLKDVGLVPEVPSAATELRIAAFIETKITWPANALVRGRYAIGTPSPKLPHITDTSRFEAAYLEQVHRHSLEVLREPRNLRTLKALLDEARRVEREAQFQELLQRVTALEKALERHLQEHAGTEQNSGK